jgi:hypothetical protein
MSASASFAELDRMSAERKGYLSEINHQKLLVGLILARDVLGEPGRKVDQLFEDLWLGQEFNQLGIGGLAFRQSLLLRKQLIQFFLIRNVILRKNLLYFLRP